MGDAFIYHGDESKRKQFALMQKIKNKKLLRTHKLAHMLKINEKK